MKKSKSVPVEGKNPATKKRIGFKAVFAVIGWGIIYIVVFYLGNITGEYVAARMPVLSFKLPRLALRVPHLSLPNIRFTWNTPQFNLGRSNAPVSHTKTLFIADTVISMPVEGASASEKEEFIQMIKKQAVVTNTIAVSGVCAVQPAFVSIKSGTTILVRSNSSQTHSIQMGQDTQALDPGKTVNFVMAQTTGAFPIACDSRIVGFYVIQ